MNFKIYLGIIGALIVVILGLLGINHSRAAKIEELRNELAAATAQGQIYAANLGECNSKISAQNEAIESIALDMKKIRQSQAGLRKEIQAKYESMEPPPKDSGCEKKLGYYERLFRGLGK